MDGCLEAEAIFTEQLVLFQNNLKPFMISDHRHKYELHEYLKNRNRKIVDCRLYNHFLNVCY